MKATLIFLITMFQVSLVKSQSESTTFKIKIDEEMVTYQFASVKDFEENYEKFLTDFESNTGKKRKKTEEKFWVEISINVTNEKDSTIVTRSINSSESSIKEDVIKLKKHVFSLLAVL